MPLWRQWGSGWRLDSVGPDKNVAKLFLSQFDSDSQFYFRKAGSDRFPIVFY
ncbi:protein of unknown function [Shinella sp. WSC3-e]|nr:hypothetical protein SHINE37_43133 [Rhizobiaceae bacterium]CAK7257690.1 protein of unknown function [Shinella sp. WSC3-e]